DGVELDPPRREQLLRLGAGGSAGAGVEARLHRVHYTRCAMAPQRPLYHRFAWAFDLVVPDASAARVRRLAALLRAAGVRPPARVLDAGCGTGNYAGALARRGYRVVGVDRSARLLADARAKGAGAGLVFVRADLTTYRPGAPFAAALCRGVLNDVLDDRARDAVCATLARAPAPGGVLLLDARARRAAGRSAVRGGGQRPWNGGGVFLLAKAVTPALKSSVRPEFAMACASSSICVSRLSHVDWWNRRLAAPKAFDGPCASSRA